jgi:asparagine synthase (glutamine-hydrolysing)
MCGIAGFTGFEDKLLGKSFLDSISYRGPDEQKSFTKNNEINFFHARLSIIDIEKGSQPLFLNNILITFNGEIYNYIELRKELVSLGYKFTTNGDTEVILACYKIYGEDFIHKFNGMFAFAIYDFNKKLLLIYNDSFAIKPLYYTLFNNELYFSSTLKSFYEIRNFQKKVNLDALSDTVQFRYSKFGETLIKNIHKLGPSEFIIWDNKKKILKTKNYYKKGNSIIRSEKEWIDQCDYILKDSIKINLRADVPISIMLSSGVDSAGILHFANQFGYQLTGYSFSTNHQNDETKDIKKISKFYNIKTVFVKFNEDEFFSNFENVISKMDYLIADSLVFPIFKLTQEISKNFKVTLTGEGADEMFGGYFHLKSLNSLEKLSKNKLIINILSKLIKFTPQNILNFFLEYDTKLGSLGKEKLINLIQYSEDITRTYNNATSIINDEELLKFTNLSKKKDKKITELDFRYLRNEMINTWLPNQILTKSDQMSMANGVEARVPFLDKRLLDLIYQLPEDLLYKNGIQKVIYREVLKKNNFLYHNKKKKAFYVPMEEKYKKNLDNLHNEYLSDNYINKFGIFKKKFVKENYLQFKNGEFIASKRIIMMTMIHKWLEINKMNL